MAANPVSALTAPRPPVDIASLNAFLGLVGSYAEDWIFGVGPDKPLFHYSDLAGLLGELSRMGIKTLMVEGGGTLLWSMFENRLVDEVFEFVGNIIIGGDGAPTPADGDGFVMESQFTRMDLVTATPLDSGVLLHWKVRQNSGIPGP